MNRLAAHHGTHDLDVFDGVGLGRMWILLEDYEVAELPDRDRTLDVLLEGRVGPAHGADPDRFRQRDPLVRPPDATRVVFARNHALKRHQRLKRTRDVIRGGGHRDLIVHQFDLLVVLAQSPGRVLSRDQIMDSLKGHPLEAFDRSIDVHISRIRALIEDDPKTPKRVLTVRGTGYVFARKQDTET